MPCVTLCPHAVNEQVMQKCLKEDSVNPTLKSVVALLKLGDWDPDVFYKFRDVILNQVRPDRLQTPTQKSCWFRIAAARRMKDLPRDALTRC